MAAVEFNHAMVYTTKIEAGHTLPASGSATVAADSTSYRYSTCYRFTLEVRPAHSAVTARAMVYVATNEEPGVGWGDYFQRILTAARELGLPAAYVRELEAWSGPRLGG